MVSISFEKVTLSNGLDVILHEDHSIPLVAVNVWYHVGSKDEQMGRTGFAHLFEHVMFEGSKHHNRNYFEPLQKAGANLNGSTTSDRTNYWEDVPSNYLELALWLESDRMGFLLEALDQQRFDIQRDVVKNERRQSYENRPYGMAHWHIQEALFPLPHPYHWMTIGSQEDLDAASLEDVKAFFRRFYSPANSSLAIAGDFDRNHTLALVERYFGDLPPGPPLFRLGQFDSDLPGRVELEMRDKVMLPRLYIAWPTPPHRHPDDAPLDLLRGVLADGLSARLHRSLVYDKQIAQSVNIRYHPAEIAGQFTVEVTAAADHDLEEVEAATGAELARIQRDPPTDEELTRVKNRMEASHYRQLARIGGFSGRADQLNHFNVFAGDPGLVNTSINTYLAVSREDILRVAESVLGERQLRLRVLPEQPLRPTISTVDRSLMPESAPSPTFIPPIPVRHRLNNGLRVAVIEQHALPILAFGLLLRAGSITDPPELPGLAAFTGQMLAEGTETRSSQEIAAAFEFIGARLNIDSSQEMTLLSTETLSKHWSQALALVADVVKHPTFPENELERVRRQYLTDLRRSKDDPTSVADQVLPGLLYGRGTRYGHPPYGTEEAVAAVRREHAIQHFRQYYGPQNATLLVVGDASVAEVVDLAEAEFGDWNGDGLQAPVDRPQEPEARNGEPAGSSQPGPTIYLIDKPGAAQSVIRAGQLTVPRHHPDYFGLALINLAFGGQFSARLNRNLREEKGYTYGYHSWINWYRGPSALLAGGSVQTAVTKEAVQETLGEFSGIHSARPLSPEEFEGAKASALRAYPASFERPTQVLNHLVQLVLHDLPDDYFQTVSSQLAAVSLAEANRIASDRVRPKRLKVLVVGDRQIIESGLRQLGLLLVVLDASGAEVSVTAVNSPPPATGMSH